MVRTRRRGSDTGLNSYLAMSGNAQRHEGPSPGNPSLRPPTNLLITINSSNHQEVSSPSSTTNHPETGLDGPLLTDRITSETSP